MSIRFDFNLWWEQMLTILGMPVQRTFGANLVLAMCITVILLLAISVFQGFGTDENDQILDDNGNVK